MRYKGLLKLGKDSYSVSFGFLEKLNLTQKEAILLQQIDYNNKTSAFLDIPKTILAEITHMSRGHLYRALKKLRSLGLIIESELGLCISDSYKELKTQNDKEIFTKKNKKIAKNVAWSLDKKRLESKQNIESNTQDIQPTPLTPLRKGGGNNPINAQNTQDSIKVDSINSNNLTPTHHPINEIESKNLSPKNSPVNSQKSESFFMTKESQNVTKVSQNETLSIHYNKNKNIISLPKGKEDIYFSPLGKDENKSLILRGKIKDLLDKLNNTIESTFCYMPNDSYLFSKIDSMIKEQEKIKLDSITLDKLDKLGVRESYLAFTNDLRLTGLFLNAEAKQAFINETKRLISTNKIAAALKASKEQKKLWIAENSDYVGRRLLAQTWKRIIEILDDDVIKTNAKSAQDSKSVDVSLTLNMTQNTQDSKQNTESNTESNSQKPQTSEEIITQMLETHGEKIQEFINYRAKKGRKFNAAALNALYATLGIAFEKGKDVEAMINQSIYRDYNWVFPLTHKFKKRKKSA